MMRYAILLAMAVSGCASAEPIALERTTVTVTVKQMDEDDLQVAAWTHGYRRDKRWLGFAVPLGDTCTIYVPHATTDRLHHETYGHELLHCLGGAWHK